MRKKGVSIRKIAWGGVCHHITHGRGQEQGRAGGRWEGQHGPICTLVVQLGWRWWVVCKALRPVYVLYDYASYDANHPFFLLLLRKWRGQGLLLAVSIHRSFQATTGASGQTMLKIQLPRMHSWISTGSWGNTGHIFYFFQHTNACVAKKYSITNIYNTTWSVFVCAARMRMQSNTRA